ncbi:unnamed protein product [Eruca vesicaria subsp. sativa]|uniref:F-box domain-containing protein n=1 Tax=Eruca vesicaria subsp. sativa TaxID=29727 RepID=A0ABC8LRS4_ERUVS|nr:unnamed protein product [Eruca vesicaria subsp. sativa]
MTRRESEDTGSLPPELMGEILIRLPAKSIGRFRCVSKLFRSLSSDQRFAKGHIDHLLMTIRNDSSRKLLVSSSRNLYALDLVSCEEGDSDFLGAVEHDYPPPNLKNHRNGFVGIIGGSCNGLVCISQGRGAMLLYNPTTREFKRLLSSPHSHRYDDEQEVQAWGFGFDDVSYDYKVVKLVGGHVVNASVYSLKANSWRRLPDLSLSYQIWNGYDFSNSGVNLNGACHWVFRLPEGRYHRKVLVCFDIKTQEFREMPLPDDPHHFSLSVCLHLVVGNLNGRLCLSVMYHTRSLHNDLWVMNEYGVASSWSIIRIGYMIYQSIKPLCFSEEEVLLKLDGTGRHMVLYNSETNVVRGLWIRGAEELSHDFKVCTYVESLISPNLLYGV